VARRWPAASPHDHVDNGVKSLVRRAIILLAGVAELADAQDLKSWVAQAACGFDSRPRHLFSPEMEVPGFRGDLSVRLLSQIELLGILAKQWAVAANSTVSYECIGNAQFAVLVDLLLDPFFLEAALLDCGVVRLFEVPCVGGVLWSTARQTGSVVRIAGPIGNCVTAPPPLARTATC
jgi:hypothetical protein